MYRVRSSGAEIGVCPGTSRIGVDVIVWAIVSEYAVDGEKFLLKSVWFSVCDSISEEDLVEEFGFIFGYGVVVEEKVCY